MKKKRIYRQLIASLKLSGFETYFNSVYWYELKLPNSDIIISISLRNTGLYEKYYIQIAKRSSHGVPPIYTGSLNKNSFNNVIANLTD